MDSARPLVFRRRRLGKGPVLTGSLDADRPGRGYPGFAPSSTSPHQQLFPPLIFTFLSLHLSLPPPPFTTIALDLCSAASSFHA